MTNFVHRDRNHPSVVLWSAGNEIGDQSDPNGAETLRKLLAVFHTEDPTRLVTAGCDHIASEPASNTARPEFLALLDVVGYNYVDRWRDRIEKYYSIDRQAFPQRRVIGTESGSMGGVRGDYRACSRIVARGRNIDVEQLWKFVRTYDYVAGDFMWTGIDYLGEARWPAKGSSAGVIDMCGFRKDGFYFYQSQWTDKPVLHLFPHWNWKGKEGQFIPVTCYTNCDTVELFLNGRSVGVKGYAFPRHGDGGQVRKLPRAGPGAADHRRPAPGLGCAVRTGHAESRGRQGWEGCGHRRGFHRRRAGGDRPRRWTGMRSPPTAATWLISRFRFRTRPAGWRPPRPTRSRSRSKAKGRSSAWTTETRRATRITNRPAGRHSTDCAWPSCNPPANRARSE